MPIARKQSFQEVRPPPTTLEPPKAGELVNVCENFPHTPYSLVSLLVHFFVVLRASPCLLSIDTFVKRRINATKFTAIPCNVRARGESAAKVIRRTWIVYPRSWKKRSRCPLGKYARDNYTLRHLVNNYLCRLATKISVCARDGIYRFSSPHLYSASNCLFLFTTGQMETLLLVLYLFP